MIKPTEVSEFNTVHFT